jgi:hypothetical protein
MSKGSPGRKKSSEHIQKIREAARRRYASDQARQAQSERMKKIFQTNPELHKMHSPESREKQSATMKQLWDDPTYAAKMSHLRNDSSFVDAVRARMKLQWADDTYRSTMQNAFKTAKRRHYTSPELLEDRDWLAAQNQHKTLTQMADDMGCSQSCMSGIFHQHGLIPTPHVVHYTGGEDQIVTYLQTLGVHHIERRTRHHITPYEIDIYLPDYNVGIEYHGTYWHSFNTLETTEQRQRHAKKHDIAAAAGIRLLQFWDTEWQTTPDICQSIIARSVKKTTSLGARQCRIGVPTIEVCRAFLTANHIQGFCPYTYAVGLYDNHDTLVMVLTIGKSRFSKHTWELLRLAVKTHTTIIGGVHRLWAQIRQHLANGETMVSYADRRLFTGQVYTELGFQLSNITPPGYGYVLDGALYSRLAFQKHKLVKKFANFDATLTEAENMFANGYRRLWDAGQTVWTYQHRT